MAAVNPYNSTFRSPVGDVLGMFGHCQHIKRCRELELNVLDCTDVYGHKGLAKQCREAYEDLYECIYGEKQKARVAAMRQERLRQYMAGERSKKNLYAETPKLDGYFETYLRNID